MIKLSKASFSRTLLLLISLALFCFLPGCGGGGGGTGDDGGDGGGDTVAGAYTITVTTDPSDLSNIHAGDTVTIKATVKDSVGTVVSGEAVTFTLNQDKSGATLATSGVGTTDDNGVAEATYTAGADDPATDVADVIKASITDASQYVTITRLGEFNTLTVTTDPSGMTMKAGEDVTISATVKDRDGGSVSGQAVTFTIFRNNSGGTIAVSGTGTTDGSGRAQATYTLGANSPTTAVQDIIRVTIPDATQNITISREGEVYSLAIAADTTTVAAGEVATITATVTNGSGNPVSGQAVSFTISVNASGGTIAIAGTGTTDLAGQVTAAYTAGIVDPTAQLTDTIAASIPNSTITIDITRLTGASTEQAASLDLAASPTSIQTDNSTTSTITVNALTAGRAILSGVVVSLSTDTGILSDPNVTTPGTVTLSCGGDKSNRTATIIATTTTSAGIITAQIPVQIVGSTVTLVSDASSISTTGAANLTVTVKDASGSVVPGATVTMTQSGTGGVTFDPSTGTTDVNGKFTTIAHGANDGDVTITATALGTTATTDITVTDASTVFSIDQQRTCTAAYTGCALVDSNPDPLITDYNPNPAAMYLTQSLEIRVNAPDPDGAGPDPAPTSVRFTATQGTFTDSSNPANTGGVITVAVGNVEAGKATAYLTTTQAGVATIQVYDEDNSSTNDTLTVAMTSATANSITLQAKPAVVSKSVGTTTGSSTLIAMVRDASNFPVGNAPVMFTIVNPTGGGETISPVVVMTAATTTGGLSLGEARATFTSGSISSGASGVQIHAEVVGTTPTVETESIGVDLTASDNDATIVIGGTAGSVAFGFAPVISYYDTSKTHYLWAVSVMVADSNGNPAPEGTVVNLSLWPIAWNTGLGCIIDPDTATTGTFWNEDINENLYLDAGEDGRRCYYADATKSTCVPGGTAGGFLTPPNSAAGTIPATVTTDANGVANFDLIYPLSSALYIVDRLRANTVVQGTETTGEVSFLLPAMSNDISPECHINGSLYGF